jgi:hypothetical protein
MRSIGGGTVVRRLGVLPRQGNTWGEKLPSEPLRVTAIRAARKPATASHSSDFSGSMSRKKGTWIQTDLSARESRAGPSRRPGLR